MKSKTYGNFQLGIADDPSNEDAGGFEFASGMDIFSESGVLKACGAMTGVTFGTGATPTSLPTWMVDKYDTLLAAYRTYVAAGTKLLECTDGHTFNLFLTNSKGIIKGLGAWVDQIVYPSDLYIGIVTAGQPGTAQDAYYSYGSQTEADFYPVLSQGGTLKIGSGRNITSMDESLTVTPEVFKLPTNFRIRSLVEHFTNLFIGTVPISFEINDSSVFSWTGTILSSGSALPDTPYPSKDRGMNALISDGRHIYGFPDSRGQIYIFDGIGFTLYKKLYPITNANASLTVSPGAVTQYFDDTILFAGDSDIMPGVYQMRDRVVCQAFVPSVATPGDSSHITIGFVKQAFNGNLFIGYYDNGGTTYHIEKQSGDKQNNALLRTLWHRIGTDRKKRWCGIKLNLKPLAASTSVAVSYRTDRDASFTSAGTITPDNQDMPLILAAQPRSREIQWKLVYTTNGNDTPELLTYDLLYEPLNTVR